MDNSIEFLDFVIFAFFALLASTWMISRRGDHQRRIQARLEQGKRVWPLGRFIAGLTDRELMACTLGSCAVNAMLLFSIPFARSWVTATLTHYLIFFGLVMCLSLCVPRLFVAVVRKFSAEL